MNYEEEKKQKEILETDIHNWRVPDCCREGWANCPHTVKRQKIKRINIGL